MAEKDGDPEDDPELGSLDPEPEPEVDPEPEPEVDPEPEPEPGDPEPSERQPSRGERRFQILTSELQEQRRRNDELNRRLDGILAGQTTRPPQGETPEAREQRLALLTPEERITQTLRESEVRHASEMRGLQFAVLDGNDRAAFEAKATVDPLFAKWKPRVETELATLRQQGQNVDREKLMYYLIGKNAVETRKEQGKRQRVEAGRRVNGQRTRPSNSGSDTQADRGRTNTLERRLENQSI